MKPWCVTIQMKATELYFHVVLFSLLYEVVLTFNYVDGMLEYDRMKTILYCTFLNVSQVHVEMKKCRTLIFDTL